MELLGRSEVMCDYGIHDFAVFDQVDHIDTPHLVASDEFNPLDMDRVVSDDPVGLFDADSLHFSFLFLSEFTLVVDQLGETEEVVAEVVSLDVEAGLTLPAHESARDGEVPVGFLESVEDFHKEFLVVHSYFLFLIQR